MKRIDDNSSLDFINQIRTENGLITMLDSVHMHTQKIRSDPLSVDSAVEVFISEIDLELG